MKIQITMEIDDDETSMIDSDSTTGLTEETYNEIFDAMSAYGDDIHIKKM
jgi:hypothetical protein